MLYLIFLPIVLANEIILSAGVGNYSRLSLEDQYSAYRTYSEIGIVTGSSILAYELSLDGMLEEWETFDPNVSAEQFQQIIKEHFHLKAYPCLFCDETIGACYNLSYRIDNMIRNQTRFIKDSIERAKCFNYDGYIVDFEPNFPIDTNGLSLMILEWDKYLHQNNLSLWLWIGYGAPYDLKMLTTSSHVKYMTMNTYVNTYTDFINVASHMQNQYTIEKLGYG